MSLRAFTMPKWGIEMQQGTVAEWLVAEGAAFEKGQLLALIETDKITNEVEAEGPGVLTKCVASAGDTLPVGALLAVFGDAGDSVEDASAFAAGFKPADASMAAGRSAAAPTPAEEPAPQPVTAPAKVALSAELAISPEARRFAEANGTDVSGIKGSGRGGRITYQDVEQAARPAPATIGGTAVSIAVGTDAAEAHFASPLARRLAVLHQINLGEISGTGPRGRISKADVLAKIPAPAPLTADNVPSSKVDNTPELLPMSPIRKTIARRLTEAKTTIPHFYLRMDVGMDKLLALRPTANMILGMKTSVNDFIVRAVALALVEVPDVNVQVHGDVIHRFLSADIAVAVATDKGLVTPIVRGADRLRLDALSGTVKALVAKAQAGRLSADNLNGGTFTVSNLGMFGIEQFDAIINPPQGAILAVGAAREMFVSGEDRAGRFEQRVTLTLSCDHRAIDGATGARFLAALKALVENPERLFS